MDRMSLGVITFLVLVVAGVIAVLVLGILYL